MPVASVVIPAHNEAASIARTLAALRDQGDLDVVVVCNGCTDETASIARRADPTARVLEIAQPSKIEAVRVGNGATSVFPRIHLDGDIEVSNVAALLAPLTREGVLATGPEREVPREGCSRLVRWYYDVWEQLPHVRSGLFGRGVVCVSAEGQERLHALPRLMGDDLAMSEAFAPGERVVVGEAVALVRPPRTLRDLVQRRIRIATGNTQADTAGVRSAQARTSPSHLIRVMWQDPRRVPKVAVFVAIHLAAGWSARRAVRSGDFTTWRRDESSRGTPTAGPAS